MAVKLNHTIVYARDKRESARFFSEICGLAKPVPMFGYFMDVELANGVTLAFADAEGRIEPQHYAFLVTEREFDQIFERVRARGLDYWADPDKGRKGEINRRDGGRGVYFDDPSGHFLEILTVPYGGWQEKK